MNNVWVFSRKEVFVHTAFNVKGKEEENCYSLERQFLVLLCLWLLVSRQITNGFVTSEKEIYHLMPKNVLPLIDFLFK